MFVFIIPTILVSIVIILPLFFLIKQQNQIKKIQTSYKDQLIRTINGALIVKKDLNMGVMPADLFIYSNSILIKASYPIQIITKNDSNESYSPIQQFKIDVVSLENKSLILSGNLKQLIKGGQTKLIIKEIPQESLTFLYTEVKEKYL